MKTCIRCKEAYPLKEFYRDRSKSDGRTPYCKKCRKEKAAAQYLKNPETPKNYANNRRKTLGVDIDTRRMGLTLEEYELMLKRQGYKCAICRNPETAVYKGKPRRLSIDHDHSCCPGRRDTCTECVRGLICSRCNVALGLLRESKSTLLSMIKYLDKWENKKLFDKFGHEEFEAVLDT